MWRKPKNIHISPRTGNRKPIQTQCYLGTAAHAANAAVSMKRWLDSTDLGSPRHLSSAPGHAIVLVEADDALRGEGRTVNEHERRTAQASLIA